METVTIHLTELSNSEDVWIISCRSPIRGRQRNEDHPDYSGSMLIQALVRN